MNLLLPLTPDHIGLSPEVIYPLSPLQVQSNGERGNGALFFPLPAACGERV
jgi:hypothetical protein